MTCAPPPGTKPGTMCVLTRGDGHQCLGEWDGGAYRFRHPTPDTPGGTFIDSHIPRDGGCRCGWVFAGVMPETARPQTAQEIAREALEQYYPSNAACVSGLKAVLHRIRDMPAAGDARE